MDCVDIALLSVMFEDGAIRLGGWDPRTSSSDVASKLGLPLSTVKARLQAWVKSGLLQGFVVFPHPKFLGGEIVGQILEIANPRAVDRLLSVAEGVPGLVHGYEAREDRGPNEELWIGYIDDGSDPAREGARVLCDVPGVKLSGIMSKYPQPYRHPYLFPPCARPTLNSLDWRLILELRAHPSRPLMRVAQKLGVSFKTVRRRFDQLLDQHALFFLPRFEFNRSKGVLMLFHLKLESNSDANEVWRAVRGLHRSVLPHALWYDPLFRWLPPNLPAGSSPELEYWTTLGSVAEAVSVRRSLAGTPGVISIYEGTPIRTWEFAGAYDRLIEGASRSAVVSAKA